jgi:hypothetical protein
MRQNVFLLLLLVTVLVCVQGYASDESTARVAKVEASALVNAHRNLRDSSTKEEDDTIDAEDEERLNIPFISKITSYFKGSSSVTKTVEKNAPLVKTLQKNPSVMKSLEDPKIVKSVQALQKDTGLAKKLSADPKMSKLRAAIERNPKKLTLKQIGMAGVFVSRVQKIKVQGDVKGMVIAYGILALAVLGIGGAGALIYNNTRNSYITN